MEEAQLKRKFIFCFYQCTNKNLYVNGASGTMITVFDLSGIVYKTLKVVDDSTIIPLGLSTEFIL